MLEGLWDASCGGTDVPGVPFLQVLVRTEPQGIRYKFNAPVGRDGSSQYSWHYTPWTKCSVLCAGGELWSWAGLGGHLGPPLCWVWASGGL